MRIYFCLLIFTNLPFWLCAQTTGTGIPNEITKIIPPSPTAAAIEKFGSIPVNYSTGVPSISFPIWSWHRQKLDFNFGLSYHAGGNKVDDMASNVGLGWSTTGVGRITRTVRGLPDDQPSVGFLYSNILPAEGTDLYEGQYYFPPMGGNASTSNYQAEDPRIAINPYNLPAHYTAVKKVSDLETDGEQDIFSYSIGNKSGRFIIDHDKKVVSLEKTNFIITPHFAMDASGDPVGSIHSFTIKDDKGVVFVFNYLEYAFPTLISSDNSFATAGYPGCVNGWLLTKQYDQFTLDEIKFAYTDQYPNLPLQYETGWSENEFRDIEEWDPQTHTIYVGLSNLQQVINYMQIASNEPLLANINFPDGTSIAFEYNHNRQDYINAKALTVVLVKNYKDEQIKKIGLEYSYFASAVHNFDPPVTSNDNYKRLRLDKLVEYSNDNSLSKTTSFTYNGTLLNCRGSRNVDFWGYNVNPIRNNGYYFGSAEWEDFELQLLKSNDVLYDLHLDGADKRPDPDFVKAAILEKISYPTGGSTTFEYECNKAFSAINYYEDKRESPLISWGQQNFNLNKPLFFQNRVNTAVEFLFKTDELINPRPPASGGTISCLEDGQDLMTASFEISSVNGAFTPIVVTDIYEHFHSGVKKVIDLPLGMQYRVKFIYDANANCAFTYPFEAACKATYYIPLQDKLAGGLRIKKITSDDGSGNLLTKQYDYNNPDGRSSAELNEIPNYGYHRAVHIDQFQEYAGGILLTHTFLIRCVSRNSSPTNTLNYFNGAPLIYKRVKELNQDGSYIQREYDPFVALSTGGTNFYPKMGTQDFANLSGLIKKEALYDNIGTLKTETIFNYNKSILQLQNNKNRNYKSGLIAWGQVPKCYVGNCFYMYSTHVEESDATTTSFENGNSITKTTVNTYDPMYLYLKSTKTKNSKNEERAQIFYYVYESGGGAANQLMTDSNMLSYPAFSQLIELPLIINGGLKQNNTVYGLYQNGTLPMPAKLQSSILTNALETDVTFDDYDTKGNLLQYKTRDGVVHAFIWGYKSQYPVAKISGKTYVDALAQSGIDLAMLDMPPADENLLRVELNKLRTLSNCMVSTYTYIPGVGISSETDPKGKTIYYEYDNFNRLKLIRDKDNNIIKRICYNYAGQPEDCN